MVSLDWQEEPPPRPRAPVPPKLSAPNRRMVEAIECPTCKSLHVGIRSRHDLWTWWECLANPTCPRWKEPPTAGQEGRAVLA